MIVIEIMHVYTITLISNNRIQMNQHILSQSSQQYWVFSLCQFIQQIQVANFQFYIINLFWFKQVFFLYLYLFIGSHTFASSDDLSTGSDYNGQFTITFKNIQLQNRMDYDLVTSFRSLSYNMNGGIFYYGVWKSTGTVNSFILLLYSSDQTFLDFTTYFTIGNYLVVSRTILNTIQIVIQRFYYSSYSCNGLNTLTQCQQDQTFSLPSINYHVFIQLQDNHATQNSNLSFMPYFKLEAFILNINIVRVTLTTQFLNFQSLGYFILLIDNQLFDFNVKKPILFESIIYSHPSAMTSVQPFILDFTNSKYVFQQNIFIGISSFKGNPSHFQINPITSGDTTLNGNIYGIGSTLTLYAIAFYGFTDACPTYVMAYTCQPCITNCIMCDVALGYHCIQCQIGFTLAPDKQSCICSPPLTIFLEICGQYPTDCLSSYLLPNGTADCSFCDPSKKLVVQSNACVCKDGYKFDSFGLCQDFCGDGIIYQSQCDDGNNASNDGCSQYCLIQDGFQCNVNVIPTTCKSQTVLRYSVDKILKKQNENVAVLYLKVENQNFLPFAVIKDNFYPLPSQIKLRIIISQYFDRYVVAQNINIDQNNEIQLQFPFKFTIQGLNGEINLNYENTKYKNETQKLNFILAGDNQSLKFEENVVTYKNLGYSMMVGAILNIVGLFIGFFTPKFIGLENILTLQLLYYSQLLIAEVSKWPPGFSFLKYVKFSGGFNQVIEITQIMPLNQISKKMSNLQISKFFIENFNINFIIIFISCVFLIIIVILRNRTEKYVDQFFKAASNQKNNKSDAISPKVKQKMNQSVIFYNKMNEIAFWISNQVAIWLILPFLFAISYEFMIPNNEYQIIDSSISGQIFLKIRGILSFLSLFMILCIGCNNFVNFWLSLSSLNVLLERPQEVIYKRALFVYLLGVGCLILFFNSASFGSVYCSTLVLVIQAAYIVVLIRIDPYKQSLYVHTVVLLFNNAVFLVFLIVINLINYVEDLNSLIILGISYFVTGCAGISIILTFVRLYYELRYGRALQEKIQEERNRKKQQQRLKQQILLKKNQQLLQLQAKHKTSEQQNLRDKNIFLYENQIKQGKQDDYLNWLANRNLTQKQKQAYYFKQFTQKPLSWMRKHDRQKFLERKKILQQEQKLRMNKQLQKHNFPQFLAVVEKIRTPYQINGIRTSTK